MLSFNNLGNLGRLANQMFQYASLKGIAKKSGYEFCIPPKEIFGKRDSVVNKDLNLYDIFEIEKNNNIGLTKNNIVQEKAFNFDSDLYNNCPDNIDLLGYFQSEKYFKNIEEEIRSDFSFIGEVGDDCKSFIKSLNSEVICLHIRRGDYTTNPNHPVQSIEYYQESLNILPSDIPVLIFSDDSDWCFDQELFKPDRFMISSNSSVDADLCMMTLCDYHIIANSSLSWWGSWLAKSKKTIAPKNWFGGSCINHNTNDLYCSDWIIL
jgi:hypothetical protein